MELPVGTIVRSDDGSPVIWMDKRAGTDAECGADRFRHKCSSPRRSDPYHLRDVRRAATGCVAVLRRCWRSYAVAYRAESYTARSKDRRLALQPGGLACMAVRQQPAANVDRSVHVGVQRKRTRRADKRGLRFPSGFVDMSAARTHPRGIARIHRQHWDTGQRRFVGEKLAELSKRPGVQYDALHPYGVPAANLDPRADVREVFKRHCSLRAFGQSYETFGDHVVGIGRKASFLSAQAAQPKPGGAGVLALQLPPKPAVAIPYVLDVRAAVHGGVTIDGDVRHAQINPKHAVNFLRRRLVHDTHGQQVERAVAIDQIGFALARGKQDDLASLPTNEIVWRPSSVQIDTAGGRCPTTKSGRRRQSSRGWITFVVGSDQACRHRRPWQARG